MQARIKGYAVLHAFVDEGFGFAVVLALEAGYCIGRSAQCREFLKQGWCGVASGIKPYGYGHEFLGDGFVGCFGGYVGDVRG